MRKIVFILLLAGLGALPVTGQGAAGWTAEAVTTTPNDDLDPVWSPDGQQIAFTGHHEGSPEVYMLDVDSREISNLSHTPEDDYRAAWSPDGLYLTYLHRDQPNSVGPHQVRLVRVADGETRIVLEASRWTGVIRWQPDGQRFYFQSGSTLYAYDLTTNALTALYVPEDGITSAYGAPIVLSPDLRYALIQMLANEQMRLLRLTLADGQIEVIAEAVDWRSPAWSPDGQQFFFVTGGFPETARLHRFDQATRQAQVIYQADEAIIYNPTWSPDGRLAWVANVPQPDEPGRWRSQLVIAAPPDYTAQTALAINPYIEALVWSPTRSHLAFHTFAGVYVLDVPSGVFHEFLQGVGKIRQMAWSPDGNFIAAHLSGIPGSNRHETAVIDIRTGELYIYGRDQERTSFGALSWSPDNRLMFSSGGWGNQEVMIVWYTAGR